jgi:membrane protease YdiL (CAAX protease family)
LTGQGAVVVAVVLVTWLFRRALDRQSFTSLGFQRDRGWLAETFEGFALGLLLMLLVLAVELLIGAYRLTGPSRPDQDWSALVASLLLAFVGFGVVAFYEELLARGYVLQNLAAAFGRIVGVVCSSALFAVAHLANPGAGLVSVIGLFVAGLLLATGYLVTGRLWLPIGLHLSWNFVQGPLFGFPVSGIETVSLVRLEAVGPDFLTGGSFGPEASMVGIAAELLGILLLARRRRQTSQLRG